MGLKRSREDGRGKKGMKMKKRGASKADEELASGPWEVLMEDSDEEDGTAQHGNGYGYGSDGGLDEDFDAAPRYEASSTTAWNSRPSLEKLPVKGEKGDLRVGALALKERESNYAQSVKQFSLVWKEGEKRGDGKNEQRGDRNSEKDDPEADESETVRKEVVPGEEKDEEDYRPLNAASMFIRRQGKKREIAALAETIMENPEGGATQSNDQRGGSSLGSLLAIASKDKDKAVRKLALLSLIAVFKDILPGYRINVEAAANDKGVVLTKEVRKLRQFERGLLQKYQSLLQFLNSLVNKGLGAQDTVQDHRAEVAQAKREQEDLMLLRKKKNAGKKNGPSSETLIAVRGMCTLLVAKSNFNYRENLLAAIIPRMNSEFAQVRAQCCACISTMLEEDVTGDTTLEVATFVTRFVRAHNHGLQGAVHPDMCKVLLHCDLKGDLKNTAALNKAKEERKKKKKKRKESDGVAAGLEEASANADLYQRAARNAEALREIFTMYLRVLKKGPQSLLMPVILKGISRYVHLINIELAQALVSALSDLIKTDVLDVEAGLTSVHTVAVTLRGPGAELHVDESEFVAYLYRAMLKLITSGLDRDRLSMLVIRAVEAVFLGRKLYQHNRASAIATRMSVLANFCSPHAALALVSCVRTLTTRYAGVCRPLFESEEELGEGGNSLALGLPPPDEDSNVDPILAGQDASALWPLAQLRFHYHPEVRSFVAKALKLSLLMPNERPQRMFNAFNPYVEGGFNPPVKKKMVFGKYKKKPRNQYKNKAKNKGKGKSHEQGWADL